ncbi:MAG: hypothetical protein HRT36_06180 [Alphaproteobacteria bacterium]|nr:hypothetical protein [Alphaproteobacteria bacterium]
MGSTEQANPERTPTNMVVATNAVINTSHDVQIDPVRRTEVEKNTRISTCGWGDYRSAICGQNSCNQRQLCRVF